MSLSMSLGTKYVSPRSLFLATLLIATPLHADEITLQGQGGSMTLTGELVEYTNGYYRIATALGEFNIDETTVECIGDGCPQAILQDGLSIAGSDTIGAELMPLLVRAMNEYSGNVVLASAGASEAERIYRAVADEGFGDELGSIRIEDRGSSTGFRALLDGTAQIAMSSRPVRRSEAEAMIDAGLGDPRDIEQEHELAVDGLLIAVSPNNPVSDLTEDQVAALLSGAIDNWSQVGGPNLPVTVYSRNANSGTFTTISNHFLTPRQMTLRKDAVIVETNEEMSAAVFNDRTAIGYVGFAFKRDTKPVTLKMACGITVRPSTFSAKTAEYPLNRTLYLYTTNKVLPKDGQNLVDFATSTDAEGVILKSGFIGYHIESDSMDAVQAALKEALDNATSPTEANLMREMYVDMEDWFRVSTTFRFRTGSSVLDNHSQRDLIRLVEFLEDLPEGTDVSLVGFTDSDGSFEANQALSVARAASVEEQLYTIALRSDLQHLDISLKGYGELNPVGCNGDFAGQRLNRRVEIWVKPS